MLFIIYLSWSSGDWPVPHPRYVAVGICQYFYLGMGYWLQSAWFLLWS